jgi:hypothetical protein
MVLLPWLVVGVAAYLQWCILAPALAHALALALPSLQALRLPQLFRCRRAACMGGGGGGAGPTPVAAGGGASLGTTGGDAVLRMAAGAAGTANGCGDVFPRYFMAGSLAAGYGCVLLVVITTILIVPSEVRGEVGS